MSQRLQIARLTPAALIGDRQPAAVLLLTAPAGLPRLQSGPPGEAWQGPSGEQPTCPFIPKSKSGSGESFIQPFSKQQLSRAVTQTLSSGLGARGTRITAGMC